MTKSIFSSPLVETDWLADNLHDPNLRVLDCSVAGQPNKDGTYTFIPQFDVWREAHIPSSVYVDIPNQLSDSSSKIGLMMPPIADFISTLKAIGVGDNTHVVLYDRGNHAWATRVWWMLKVSGFTNAAVLNGGWRKWQAEGRKEESGDNKYPTAQSFSNLHRPELMANKNQVLAAINDDSITLLNALPAAVFTGEVSPYARPGRITGSKNLSCDSIIDPESYTYLNIQTIQEMATASGALQSESVITYCGGGIAASSTAFALSLLGVENITLYDGSLSEWAIDPDLPMETG